MAISKNNEIRSNLLQCPLDNNDKLFFTLMDHLNNLFMSNDPKDILRFYDFFDNRDQLIKWMMERPKGNYRSVEFNKDENDIIVVIPTMDVNGKFAKTCRDEIFKGLHIIFVESGIGNYYFNYAHNCNAGIKKAMEYKPKWIILSNDDMYKIDDIKVLKNELENLNKKNIDIILNDPPKILKIGKPTIIRNIINIFYNSNTRNKIKLEKYIIKKFKIKIYSIASGSYKDKLLYNNIYTFYSMGFLYGTFTILNFRIVKNYNGNLFDETYINGLEDIDFFLRINMKEVSKAYIKFKIGTIGGLSLGKVGSIRTMREIINNIYFNYKFENFWGMAEK